MTEDEVERLFARIASFAWNESKRASNLRKHGIDFADVIGIFDTPALIHRSDRHGEIRYQIIGIVEGREVAVACAIQGESCRIISARRARRDERRAYHDHLPRRPATGAD